MLELNLDCRKILDVVPDHVALVNSQGVIVSTNAAWKKFSDDNGGNIKKTGVGANYYEVCQRSAERGFPEAAQLAEALSNVIRGGVERREIAYPCHSPRVLRWYSAQIARLDLLGEPLVAVMHSNVTIRTILRERVQELTLGIQEARRKEMVQEWASFLAHEIKNPLSTILLRSQLLRRLLISTGHSGSKMIESCDAILKTAQRICFLIDDARNSASSDFTQIETIAVGELLEDLAAVSISRKGEEINLDLSGVQGGLALKGSRVRLASVLYSVLRHFAAERVEDENVSISGWQDNDFVILRMSAKQVNHEQSKTNDLWLAERMLDYENGKLFRDSHAGIENIDLVFSGASHSSARAA